MQKSISFTGKQERVESGFFTLGNEKRKKTDGQDRLTRITTEGDS